MMKNSTRDACIEMLPKFCVVLALYLGGCDRERPEAKRQYEKAIKLVSPGMRIEDAKRKLHEAGFEIVKTYKPSKYANYHHTIVSLRERIPDAYGYAYSADVDIDAYSKLVIQSDDDGWVTCVDVGRANIKAMGGRNGVAHSEDEQENNHK